MSQPNSGGGYNFTLEHNTQPRFNSCGFASLPPAAKNAGPWCGDYKMEATGAAFRSLNQPLAGTKQHPRTYVAPVITPPSYDLEHWKKNDFNKYFSQINRPRQQDLALSGYVSGPCPRSPRGCGTAIAPQIVKEDFVETGEAKGMVSTVNTAFGGPGGAYDLYAGREAILSAAEDTAKKNVARMYAREMSLGPLDGSVVNGAFIENAVDGGFRDPFRADCRVPNTDPAFTNPEIKDPCEWGCAPPLAAAPPSYDVEPVSKTSTCETSMCSQIPARFNPRSTQPIAFAPRQRSQVRENFEYSTQSAQSALSGGSTDSTTPPTGAPVYGGAARPYSAGEEEARSPRYPYYDAVVAERTDVGPGYVNTACGYDAAAPAHGLPVNRCVGPAQLRDSYAAYNRNQGMQIVQPGMFYQSEVLDPISANIGISHSQQFNPQTARATAPGEVVYTDHDATQYVGANFVDNKITGEELQNIYDPRYTGYASNDRYYLDAMTGQPRFFYDDIDGVKRPSYIVRSNVDHIGDFDQTGAMKHGTLDFDYREIANTQFHESALDLRSDIQTRLAQKNYARTAQLRDMPLSNTGRLRGR